MSASRLFTQYHYRLPGRLLLFGILFMALDAAAGQDGQGSACPAAEVSSELTIRKDKLIKLQSGLEDFPAGKIANGIPLSALFLIDLTDAAAVANRVTDLQQQAGLAKNDQILQDPFLSCALSMQSLRPLANELLTLQQTVA